jgi:endopolyphosphatase
LTRCWKKYVLWSRQYRDVIVGHLYGHMNLDHFTLLDSVQLKPPHLKHPKKPKKPKKGHKSDHNPLGFSPDMCSPKEFDPEEDPSLSTSSAESYLSSLREAFADMVLPADVGGSDIDLNKHLGGKWAERYVLAHISPSVVPNYFPTLRVMEYNITNLVDAQGMLTVEPQSSPQDERDGGKKGQALGRNKDKVKKPAPPAKTAPPGPAYSMQPYTFIGYTQYFLNLTKYNNPQTNEHVETSDELRKRNVATDGKGHAKLQFEVEYDTRTDRTYKLKDLTVRSYVRLARAIVDASSRKKKKSASGLLVGQDDGDGFDSEDSVEEGDQVQAGKKKRKKKKKHKNKARDKVWHTFVKRAFVGTVGGKELKQYEARRVECAPPEPET